MTAKQNQTEKTHWRTKDFETKLPSYGAKTALRWSKCSAVSERGNTIFFKFELDQNRRRNFVNF